MNGSELQQILDDVVSGVIDTATATQRIAALKAPSQPERSDPVSLYDSVFCDDHTATRAACDEPDASDAQPESTPEHESPLGDAESHDEHAERQGESEKSDPEPDAHSASETVDSLAFNAGEFLRNATDKARQAAEKVSEFISAPSGNPVAGFAQAFEKATSNQVGGTVTAINLRAVGTRVRIVGDESVTTLSARGPHTLRRSGSTVEISTQGEKGPAFKQFSLLNPPRTLEDLRTLGFGAELVIRVNPAIRVNAEVTGGRLAVENMPALGTIRVTAGGSQFDSVHTIDDLLIQAGACWIAGTFDRGHSRVRVESGNLDLRLDPASDVAIKADTQLGIVSWPEKMNSDIDEYLVGSGSARLELGAILARICVKVK